MKNVMYLFSFLLLGTLLMSNTSGCESNSPSNIQLAAAQETLMQEANRQVGMPAIVHFQERKLAKMIFEARDREDLICYLYLQSMMSGKMVYMGKCMGYGLPYSVQFTNPQQAFQTGSSIGAYTLPQADPNGLFMPEGLSATWVFMLDSKDVPHAVYVEQEVFISPFKLTEGVQL